MRAPGTYLGEQYAIAHLDQHRLRNRLHTRSMHSMIHVDQDVLWAILTLPGLPVSIIAPGPQLPVVRQDNCRERTTRCHLRVHPFSDETLHNRRLRDEVEVSTSFRVLCDCERRHADEGVLPWPPHAELKDVSVPPGENLSIISNRTHVPRSGRDVNDFAMTQSCNLLRRARVVK
jgi:hypothetical protein